MTNLVTVDGTGIVVAAKPGTASTGNAFVAVWLEADVGKNRPRPFRIRGNAFGDHRIAVGDVVQFSGSAWQCENTWRGEQGVAALCLLNLTLTVPEPPPAEHWAAHKYPEGSAIRGALNAYAARVAAMGDAPDF